MMFFLIDSQLFWKTKWTFIKKCLWITLSQSSGNKHSRQ